MSDVGPHIGRQHAVLGTDLIRTSPPSGSDSGATKFGGREPIERDRPSPRSAGSPKSKRATDNLPMSGVDLPPNAPNSGHNAVEEDELDDGTPVLGRPDLLHDNFPHSAWHSCLCSEYRGGRAPPKPHMANLILSHPMYNG